ncbi:Di-sulfide bridge nucleocytoplasmic transport domain-containing protein [Boeremia exigua]|uniref:Di-sulfide bridge nucleocytoplasmic transport domain-containing protein n=1 Tax=Boeremia exigua TaxID=749465 RepID=UPI001E8E94B3|nr:Di-sulfide bridge nucleocytoplasmic transport domain-containing protein [Boeremia exigua]KAH6616879.1 Di-sulfide bridge nucleocytoplasmic transport domain-containing protein [Boeremia exigua]
MSRGGTRESLTPMDFEYDNKYGPVDAASPFLAHVGARKRGLDPAGPNPFLARGTPQRNRGQPHPESPTKHGFDSPSKNAFATPSRAREPFNFTPGSSRPIPSIPHHVNNTWTPRTPAADFDFSSGGETPTTPALDSEQPTPDTQMAGQMRLLMDSPSPKKPGRRQSFFRAIKNFAGSPSPAKEAARDRSAIRDLEKEVSRKHYADKLENRVVKRRSRDRPDRTRRKHSLRADDPDASDPDPDPPRAPASREQPATASIAAFFHWIEAHPSLPSVLSYYLQFSINAVLALAFLYSVYLIYDSVTADITIEAHRHQAALMVEIAQCVKNYRENHCEPESRTHYMEAPCANWETCMSRDPQKLARASVSVKAFAHIINGFFEEFSYKSMIFLTALLFTGLTLSNYALALLRHSTASPPPPPPPHYDYPPVTPRHAPQTPGGQMYIEGAAWGGFGGIEGRGIESRGLEGRSLEGRGTEGEVRGFIQPPPLVHSQSTPALGGG